MNSLDIKDYLIENASNHGVVAEKGCDAIDVSFVELSVVVLECVWSFVSVSQGRRAYRSLIGLVEMMGILIPTYLGTFGVDLLHFGRSSGAVTGILIVDYTPTSML